MQVIVITGASRGIGAATALLAAKEGYTIVVNYRSNKEAAEDVVSSITSGGGTAVAIQSDISKEHEVIKLFAAVDKLFPGRLYALVNNAGILEKQTTLADTNAERLQRIFAVNTIGQFLCARESIRRMARSRGGQGGVIVNVSSIAARTGAPGEYIDYAASKGALDTMTIGLSKEVAGDGIRVNAVRPAFIDTDIHATGGEPGRIERLIPVIPLKRGGRATEVAEAIVWLISDKSSYTTGTFIDVSGGR